MPQSNELAAAVTFTGLTAYTPAGHVDMVVVDRILEGDRTARVAPGERRAAILALSSLGMPVDRIAMALNIHKASALEVVTAFMEGRDPAPLMSSYTVDRRDRRERRRSERRLVDGCLVHPEAKHGTSLGYREFGCECSPCKRANADEAAARRRKRDAGAAS